MMRVLAATSSDDVQGLRTEADEIVGEVSVGGSVFLILIVGIGGAVIGLALFSAFRTRKTGATRCVCSSSVQQLARADATLRTAHKAGRMTWDTFRSHIKMMLQKPTS